jgi:exosortase/archaeosortase family protein
MLLTLSALATVFVLVVRRPLLDRLVLVASAVPIAVAANVARITATGLAYNAWGQHNAAARAMMHDAAGLLMMPLALVLLWLEMRLLGVLLVEEAADAPLPIFAARHARGG